MVAIAKRGTYGSKHRVVIVGSLDAEQGAMIQQIPYLVCILAESHLQQGIMFFANALLCLQLGGKELSMRPMPAKGICCST